MISWSSQIWFISPLKFFFYVFVFFSSKVQVRTSFYFLYYFFCSYMCFLSMPLFFVTETWWKWNQVISLYSLSILFLSLELVVHGNLLSWHFCYYHFLVWVPHECYNRSEMRYTSDIWWWRTKTIRVLRADEHTRRRKNSGNTGYTDMFKIRAL